MSFCYRSYIVAEARAGADLHLSIKLHATANALMQAPGKPQEPQSAESPLQRSLPLCRFENNFYAPNVVPLDYFQRRRL